MTVQAVMIVKMTSRRSLSGKLSLPQAMHGAPYGWALFAIEHRRPIRDITRTWRGHAMFDSEKTRRHQTRTFDTRSGYPLH